MWSIPQWTNIIGKCILTLSEGAIHNSVRVCDKCAHWLIEVFGFELHLLHFLSRKSIVNPSAHMATIFVFYSSTGSCAYNSAPVRKAHPKSTHYTYLISYSQYARYVFCCVCGAQTFHYLWWCFSVPHAHSNTHTCGTCTHRKPTKLCSVRFHLRAFGKHFANISSISISSACEHKQHAARSRFSDNRINITCSWESVQFADCIGVSDIAFGMCVISAIMCSLR